MTLRMFNGSSAYELQIGKFVFQVPHTAFVSGTGSRLRYSVYHRSWLCRNFGLYVWVDPYGSWNVLPMRITKPW